jgi:hypothetical protein
MKEAEQTEQATTLWNRMLELIRESVDYFKYSLIEGDWLTALLFVFVILIILFVLMVIIANLWEAFLANLPYLVSHPFGLPPSRRYLVRVGSAEALEYTWKYPYLIVGGSRYRFNKYVIDKDNPLKFQTSNGTLFEFEKKPPSTET